MIREGILREFAGLIVTVRWLLDLAVLSGAFFLAFAIYPDFPEMPTSYNYALIGAIIGWALFFPQLSLHRGWRGESLRREVQHLTIYISLIFAGLAVISVATKTTYDYSRVWFLTWFVLSWVGIISYRGLLRIVMRWFRAAGFNQRHIVVIGEGDILTVVTRRVKQSPWTGFQVAASFGRAEHPSQSELLDGTLEQGLEFLKHNQVDQIWIAMPMRCEDQLAKLLYELRHSTADIRYIPDFASYRLFNHSLSEISGLPVINLSATPMEGVNRVIKAFEDRMLAGVILLLISPLMLLIALAVKLTSRGPVFFKQQRVSWNGKPINVIKFRTMPVDVESKSGPVWARKTDNRCTPIGGFLRRTSLDELPQFINVLHGDMSIVGPRPERPVFVEKFKEEIPDYMKKHVVKAGITGWAQVNGWRGNTDLHKRIEHDLYYIENWSLLFDLKIIVLTIFKGFIHKNAY